MTVYLTVGAPASGKSTWARQAVLDFADTVIVERDMIRALHGFTYAAPKDKIGVNERFVTKVQHQQIEAALLDDMNVIVSDTNINKKFRNDLIKFCHRLGADVTLVVFDVPLDELVVRDLSRTAAVGADVVNRFYHELKQQIKNGDLDQQDFPVQSYEPYIHRDGLPDAIVVDFDGTVARGDGHRSPFDYSKVGDDEPIEDIIKIISAVAREGSNITVIGVSGRDDSCFKATINWSLRNQLVIDQLHMRKTGDVRPDWVIKNEIYDEKIIPFYNILGVFDDRDQVVYHLRRRGITVLQVAPGRF